MKPATGAGFPSWCRIVRDATACENAPSYATGETIQHAADSYGRVAWLAREETERFVALYLDNRHRLLCASVVSVGTVGNTLVNPREVFRMAIAVNASALVVAHNHPSGDPAPSAEDKALTERLRKAGELLGMRVLDHIVVGAGRFVSLAELERW